MAYVERMLALDPPQIDATRSVTRGATPQAVPLVSAVMPCLNEARTLGLCIRKAQSAFAALGIVGEVVVADNGSDDGSVEIARSLGARVVHQPERGYGAALRAGIDAAIGDIVVMGDSDDSYDWTAIGPFVQKVREGNDLVMGNRFRGGIERGAMPPLHRYLGNPVLSTVSRIAFRVPVGDFHCGMRAFRRSAWSTMRIESSGMEFATEMVAGAARAGLRIAEVPTRLYPDKRGRPPHLRSFRDGWRHLRFIVTHAPDHLYLWPGGAMLAAGLLLQGLLAGGPATIAGLRLGIHFLALGGLLSLLGLNLVLMGTLAKLAVGSRYPAFVAPTIARLRRRFRLEWTLAAGATLFAAGFAIDALLLAQWLSAPGTPMEGSVHPAFVATHAMAMGANLGFGAFLTQLMLGLMPESGAAPESAARRR